MSNFLTCELEKNYPINEEYFVLQFEWKTHSPKAGQFFMMKPQRSSVFLLRPISIFEYNSKEKILKFLIAKRGKGTEELSQLQRGDKVILTGPLGNTWAEFLPDIGKAALDEGAYVSYIHRHNIEDLDIWSLNHLVHTQPYMSYREKIWGYLNQRSLIHLSDNNFGLYRNCRFHMALFLREEKKTKDALAMLAEVVFHDLSGATNNYNPQFTEVFARGFFPYEHSTAATAPGIITEIVDCQKELEYSNEELKSLLIERMDKLSAPLQLFTVEECVQIILLEIQQDNEGLTKMYADAKKAFKQKYPSIKL